MNRSVPLWRNEVLAVFWSFRDKKKQADGARRGFAWHVVLYLPEVKSAVEILWNSWHIMAKRKGFEQEIPSFLSCNFKTGQPVATADFNKFLVSVLVHLVTNPKLLSSYSLRRIQSSALDIRDASWEDRHRIAAWSLPGARMEDCMPVRYSGVRAAGEVEVKAVQQIMFSEMRAAAHVKTWAQARQGWVALPPGTLSEWQSAASAFLVSHSSKQQALRVEHLVSAAVQPTFELIPGVISSGSPGVHSASQSGSKSGEAGLGAGKSHSTSSGQSDDVVLVWRAPVPKKAHAHACQGALPLCRQKKQCAEASIKSDLVTFSDLGEAERKRPICGECLRIFKSQESKETQAGC